VSFIVPPVVIVPLLSGTELTTFNAINSSRFN